jgi:molybdopterin-guanine dinucleotide biosynthesis protein A
MSLDDVTALVLAGGSSRRFGSDKLSALLHGTSVLDHLLTSLPQAWPVIVVGARRETARPVQWAREDPPGGGPLAGVAAGVALVPTEIVAVVAGDMPYAGPPLAELVTALRNQPPDVAGVVAIDDGGDANPLLATYRTAALARAIPTPAHGHAAKLLLGLPHTELTVHGVAARDVDTRADLDELDAVD